VREKWKREGEKGGIPVFEDVMLVVICYSAWSVWVHSKLVQRVVPHCIIC